MSTVADDLQCLISSQWERPEDVLDHPRYAELLEELRAEKKKEASAPRRLRLLFIEEKLERCLCVENGD